MIKVGEVLVSDDIKDKEFVCNLEKCKGACCVEGDFGAPLEESELAILEEIYPIVKPYLTKEGIAAIEATSLRLTNSRNSASSLSSILVWLSPPEPTITIR